MSETLTVHDVNAINALLDRCADGQDAAERKRIADLEWKLTFVGQRIERGQPTPPAEPVPDTVEQAIRKAVDERFGRCWPDDHTAGLDECDGCWARDFARRFYALGLAAGAQGEREAFRAGYHCRWHRDIGRYCFDPAMSPGDPDGAYTAWKATPPDAPAETEAP